MNEASLIGTVMSGFLLILLIYALFSSIFQFIFVDYLSLKTKELLPHSGHGQEWVSGCSDFTWEPF
jgi:hypothetical protein